MVHVVGIRVFLVLAIVHRIFSQQGTTLNGEVTYGNVEHRSYTENVKLSSYAHHVQGPQVSHMKSPEIAETHITKHPDEKIVHHPSPIYVKRPPTFVTINHPDIVIEPNPVVYHKPAAVVRSPIIYRNLPRKIQYSHVVKHIVKPIEQKVVLDRRQQTTKPQIITQRIMTTRQQPSPPTQYYFTQESDASNDAREYVDSELDTAGTATNVVYQNNINGQFRHEETVGARGEVMDDNKDNRPLGFGRIYYKQSFPQHQLASPNVGK